MCACTYIRMYIYMHISRQRTKYTRVVNNGAFFLFSRSLYSEKKEPNFFFQTFPSSVIFNVKNSTWEIYTAGRQLEHVGRQLEHVASAPEVRYCRRKTKMSTKNKFQRTTPPQERIFPPPPQTPLSLCLPPSLSRARGCGKCEKPMSHKEASLANQT
jgi:hypothetical protein